MGVCDPECVNFMTRGDGRGGSEGLLGQGRCLAVVITMSVEEGERSIFYHVNILFMSPCDLIPARPFTQHRVPTKRGRLAVYHEWRSVVIAVPN